jgi:hypothetical protein
MIITINNKQYKYKFKNKKAFLKAVEDILDNYDIINFKIENEVFDEYGLDVGFGDIDNSQNPAGYS